MPIYHCHTPQRLLTNSAKAKLAGEITRIHGQVTGEQPSFINVLFLDIPEGTSFKAGKPSTRSFVFGEIRCGYGVTPGLLEGVKGFGGDDVDRFAPILRHPHRLAESTVVKCAERLLDFGRWSGDRHAVGFP